MINYNDKYIKYKEKYLLLKSKMNDLQIGGKWGNAVLTTIDDYKLFVTDYDFLLIGGYNNWCDALFNVLFLSKHLKNLIWQKVLNLSETNEEKFEKLKEIREEYSMGYIKILEDKNIELEYWLYIFIYFILGRNTGIEKYKGRKNSACLYNFIEKLPISNSNNIAFTSLQKVLNTLDLNNKIMYFSNVKIDNLPSMNNDTNCIIFHYSSYEQYKSKNIEIPQSLIINENENNYILESACMHTVYNYENNEEEFIACSIINDIYVAHRYNTLIELPWNSQMTSKKIKYYYFDFLVYVRKP